VEHAVGSPRHATGIQLVSKCLKKNLADEWELRIRCGVTLRDSELEPDIAVVPGPMERYELAHPRSHDLALAIEIADSTLAYERGPKRQAYARNGIAHYWIVNLIDRVVECHSNPSPDAISDFHNRRVFQLQQVIPMILHGRSCGSVAVAGFFPAVR
jgi:Uma2 family endonuclease